MEKAIAVSNNDIALVAWTYDRKLVGCLGFSIRRLDLNARTETALPAWVGFQGDNPAGEWKAKDTDTWPIQKFNWKDLTAKRGGLYQYRIIPMGGEPGALQPLAGVQPLLSNPVQLSANRGAIKSYFNRGILASQAVGRQLPRGQGGTPSAKVLRDRIDQPRDPLRNNLSGDMCQALMSLLDRAQAEGGKCYLALYELSDTELVQHLIGSAFVEIILASAGESKDPDATNAPARQSLHESGVRIADRIMPSGHIGHNKFVVYCDASGAPKAVLAGSTNWTPTGLCAQTNNSVVVESPALASVYLDYWHRLKGDTEQANGTAKALQASAFRTANDKVNSVTLEDRSATIDLYFSPNTPKSRVRARNGQKPDEATPVDLAEVFDRIAGAKQAVIFLAFQPGTPSIMDAIAEAQVKNDKLFVRGALTQTNADVAYTQKVNDYRVQLFHAAAEKPDASVIPAKAIEDQFGVWEKELLAAGHAVIHDKIVVIDPFSDDCAVIMGSHNLGYQASYNNDENMLVIKGHRGLAEAYAAHVMDVYDHYRFRYLLQSMGAGKAFQFLASKDDWQDKYFKGGSGSAELAFWLGATPVAVSAGSSDALRGTAAPTSGTRPAHAASAAPAFAARVARTVKGVNQAGRDIQERRKPKPARAPAQARRSPRPPKR